MVGSVSEEAVVSTDADQFIDPADAGRAFEKNRREQADFTISRSLGMIEDRLASFVEASRADGPKKSKRAVLVALANKFEF